MRTTIAKELTRRPSGGLYLTTGSFTWVDEPYAIYMSNSDEVIGYVLDIRREDDGRITGFIEIPDERWTDIHLWNYPAFGRVIRREDSKITEFEFCEIRVSPQLGVPKDVLKNVW